MTGIRTFLTRIMLLIFPVAVLITACVQPIFEWTQTVDLTVSFGQVTTRTFVPADVIGQITNYHITLSRAGYESVELDTALTSEVIPDLVVGSWDVQVDAKNSGGAIIATGSDTINLVAGTTNDLTINLECTIAATGSFLISLRWPDVVGIDTPDGLKVSTWGPLDSAFGSPVSLTIAAVDGGGYRSAQYQESPAVSGSYTLKFEYYKAAALYMTVIEVVQVYDNLETLGTIQREVGDFATPPAAPGSLTLTNTIRLSLDLTWDNTPCITETSYVVQRSTEPDYAGAVVFDYPAEADLNANKSAWTDNSGIVLGETYYYRIAAVNDFGQSAWAEASIVIEHYYLESNVTISSQAGFDSLVGYTGVTGFLYITTDTHTDLSGLANITYVGDRLEIYDTSALTSLDGLQNLTEVGTSLQMSNNYSLASLDALQNLTNVGTYVNITGNPELTSLTGLQNLTSIGTSLTLGVNNLLTDISALSGISTVPGAVTIRYNPVLPDVTGLQNVGSIGGAFTIEYNDLLANLDAFADGTPLSSIAGLLSISGNPALNSISGLSGLLTMPGDVTIFSNAGLANLNGLHNITRIDGTLLIYDMVNEGFTDLTGLDGLESIGGNLVIGPSYGSDYDNAYLTSFQGLEKLTAIEGSLHVRYNERLASLNGLQFLTSIGADLYLGYTYYSFGWKYVGSPLLADISALSGLSTVPGDLCIFKEDSLTDLSGLGGLTSVTGSIFINSNSGFGVVSLDGIGSVGGYVTVENNITLQTFSMNGIASLSRYVRIFNNDDLTSFSFSQLGTVEDVLTVSGNAKLTSFDLSALNSVGIDAGDSLTIEDNDALVDVDGFGAALSLITGGLSVTGNAVLDNLDGFYDAGLGLATVGNGLWIYQNPLLKNLNGLSALTSLGGELSVITNGQLLDVTGLQGIVGIFAGGVNFTSNTALHYLQGLHNITEIGGALTLTSNGLLSLTEIGGITDIGGAVHIEGNIALQDLNMTGLDTIGSNLYIFNNPGISTLAGLGNVTTIGGNLDVSTNASLKDLTMPLLTTIGGYFRLHNSRMNDFTGLGALQTIAYAMMIYDNNGSSDLDSLTSFDGLNSLSSINGSGEAYYGGTYYGLRITNNNYLLDLDGLSDIDGSDSAYISSTARVEIENNSLLTSISGLEHVTACAGFIEIINNDSLTTLAGMLDPTYSVFSNNITIENNDLLADLLGLSGITQHTGNQIRIANNEVLPNLDDLTNLNTVAYYIFIYDNNGMSATAFDNFMKSGANRIISGQLHVRGNDVFTDAHVNTQLGTAPVITVTGGSTISDNGIGTDVNL